MQVKLEACSKPLCKSLECPLSRMPVKTFKSSLNGESLKQVFKKCRVFTKSFSFSATAVITRMPLSVELFH